MTLAAPQFHRLALLLAALIAAGFASAVRAEEFVKAFPVTSRPTVRVQGGDASVRIITEDTKQVEFRVKYNGYALDKDLQLDARNVGNEFELTEKEISRTKIVIGFARSRSVDIEVRMPREADLDVRTGDGSIEVATVDGNVDVHTGDGGIRAAHLTGRIDLEAHDGSINADSLKGELRLHAGDGAIEARNLDGTCNVSTGDGSIRIDGRFDGLDIRSGDGSVNARAVAGSAMTGPWSIRTGDGPVELAVPKEFKANLDASTGDGHINVDVPVTVQGKISNSSGHGAMNGGGPTLSIRTGDGSIRLNTL
jgi:DUF4097 and DUF4098 domain-containing protein YvlB